MRQWTMADRPITHVVPVDDGYEHTPEDCLCGPDIRQVDGMAELGTDGRDGALTFVHKPLTPSHQWQICNEVDVEA